MDLQGVDMNDFVLIDQVIENFARGLDDKRWMEPATGKFHFKLAGGNLTEVSEPED